jgi:Protein of unknown function (DUF4058)
MPSPFPGMDPFIENQIWEDFHHALIEVIREALIPQTRPHYVVRVEERVYVEHEPSSLPMFIRPDVTVLERTGSEHPPESTAAATTVSITPVLLHLPVPERIREAFLMIRERETMEVVTVIEVLSPGNKRAGSDGRREYLRKREEVLLSYTHLVELDLLRGGERLPTIEPLPQGDYYAFIRRRQQRLQAEVYAWSLRQSLPSIPVPLAEADADVVLDLHAIFNTVYNRTGYDYSLNYRRVIEPPLTNADNAWAQQLLAALFSAG